MGWRETNVPNERMRFVCRLEAGERMVDLCAEFGISRKTGYKFWNRYQEAGPEGLGDYSRRPHQIPNRTRSEIEALVLEARAAHPTWGPKKLEVVLRRDHPGVAIPVASTIGEILSRGGMVRPRRRRRRATPTPPDQLHRAVEPNDVWCVDFKGQFRLGNRRYCYPLTITDLHSRYLIACDALDSTRTDGAIASFEHAFRTYGLPKVIRSDNGSPFASTGLGGFSRLSVWWMRLGIIPERIEPGHPEQNGQHERMHRTLKEDTTRPAAANELQQDERFDRFREVFNEERPHEALGMATPASIYVRSTRIYPGVLDDLCYPLHDRVTRVQSCGHINVTKTCRGFLGQSFAGELVGLRELDDGWLVTFINRDLGILGHSGGFKPC